MARDLSWAIAVRTIQIHSQYSRVRSIRSLKCWGTMKLNFRILATLAATAALAVSVFAVDPSKFAGYKLVDMKTGKPVSFGAMKGKYKAIFIDVFASWCGPCKKVVPMVKKLNSEYGKKVLFVGLALNDTKPPLEKEIKKQAIDYTVYL